MLQFDDSRYVDAKQYHLASFSTRKSTLNTSLRKAIRMQDFIQLCDSVINNGNRIEWSTIQGVIGRVISKSAERAARGQFEIKSTITP